VVQPQVAHKKDVVKQLPRNLANSLDKASVREVLDGAVDESSVGTQQLASGGAHWSVSETQPMTGDTLLNPSTQTAPVPVDTLLSSDIEEQRTLGKSECDGLRRRSSIGSDGATTALVADLQAALAPDPATRAASNAAHSAGVRNRIPKGPGRSAARSDDVAVDIIETNAARAGSAGSASSTPSANSNGRAHLMSAARSVLTTNPHGSNSSKGVDHEKSATWPVAPPNTHSYKGLAGRPSTPETERLRRKEREDLRTMQKCAALTIPFVDGQRSQPPAAFLESLQVHEIRQCERDRRKISPAKVVPTIEAVSEKPNHRQKIAAVTEQRGLSRQIEDARSKSVPNTRPLQSVPTIHAPPMTHATVSAQRPVPGGRRPRTNAAASPCGNSDAG
jgi:hypothetical protein